MNRAPLPPRKTRVRSRSRTKRPPPGKDERLRAFVRCLSCLIGRECFGPVDPAHVPKTWNHYREDTNRVVPLCRHHHDLQEGRSEAFEREFSVDLTSAAREATRRYRETKAA